MLYKAYENEIFEWDRGVNAMFWGTPLWFDGLGMVGYVAAMTGGGNDWYYGAISPDGKAFKINDATTSVEVQDLILDELRDDAIIDAHSTSLALEFYASNGLYAGESWADKCENILAVDFDIRGKTKLYRRHGGKVQSAPHGAPQAYTWDDVCDVDDPIITADAMADTDAVFYPRKDGNYYVIHNRGGTIQAFNPLAETMFGPVLTLEDRRYYHIGYSKEMDVFIACYENPSYAYGYGTMQVWANETVPDAVSEVEVVGGGDMLAETLTEVEVYVTGDRDEPAPNEYVDWSIDSGDGSLLYQQTVTDDTGRATNFYVPDGTFPFACDIKAAVSI